MLANELHKKILIVDRDVAEVEPLRQKLADVGFVVRAITDSSAAISIVAEQPPHLVMVDWNMAGMAAFEIINQIRTARVNHMIRVIISSSIGGEQDVVAALNFGADDFVAKPFSVREVVARVCAILRCRPQQQAHRSKLSCDALELDADSNRVTARGKIVNLRGIEYRLLEFLMSNPGRTFNRGQLLTQVWGGDTAVDERTVDVNVQRLRKILSDSGYEAYVQTIRGFGYRFSAPTPPYVTES